MFVDNDNAIKTVHDDDDDDDVCYLHYCQCFYCCLLLLLCVYVYLHIWFVLFHPKTKQHSYFTSFFF